MLIIDLIGVATTVLLIGIRYPHYVLLAVCLHALGEILITVFLHGQIDTIVAAGAFGTITATNYNASLLGVVLVLSGSLTNYIVSSLAGGIAFEPTSRLINPISSLKFPFAVINFRLCILAGLISIWKIFM
ncbi:MAG: hypothetical protein K0R78_1337 [Pelosinus sp.]|jgi:hypothetical protein|nr:hypothetical protein [Pelosinus sp.]